MQVPLAAPLAGPGAVTEKDVGGPCRLSILGATGSIGQNTLDLVQRNPDRFEVVALTAQNNVGELAKAAIASCAQVAVIADEALYQDLKAELSGSGIEPAAGRKGLVDAAHRPADCVMAAIVGAAGLEPTLAAVGQGCRVALANKECLVAAGDVFMQEVAAAGAELIPVDSEHSAVFQAISGNPHEAIERVVLTASGGPFFDWPIERIIEARPHEALKHPIWSMGAKISIDSATMMNKGLELIEAYHLFPVSEEQLDAVIHRQSVVHCMVSFRDGSVIAQMGDPDMRSPISLALAWPERMDSPTRRLDLVSLGQLTFEAPDAARFPALGIARQALRRGGSAPAILNAANEVAVAAYLEGRIGFCAIAETVEQVLDVAEGHGIVKSLGSITEVLEVDASARTLAKAAIAR